MKSVSSPVLCLVPGDVDREGILAPGAVGSKSGLRPPYRAVAALFRSGTKPGGKSARERRQLGRGGALGLFLLLVILGGCSHEYEFIPQSNLDRAVSDPRGATYPIWSGVKEGSVALKYLGAVDLKPKKDAKGITALHVRMSLQNLLTSGDWKLDVGSTRLVLPGSRAVQAAYVDTDVTDLPRVTLAPGQKLTLDYYFPLPASLASATKIPEFSVSWTLETPGKRIDQTTQFARVEVQDDRPLVSPYSNTLYDYPYAPGWGPYWWANPMYSSAFFM